MPINNFIEAEYRNFKDHKSVEHYDLYHDVEEERLKSLFLALHADIV